MEGINFALPTLATGSMSKADQIDVLLNQPTAVIVCCYLEHMNKAMEKGIGGQGANFISQTELVSLINDVQAALKSV
jgi:hypothetical protein